MYNYDLQFPRIIGRFTLVADIPITLKKFIEDSLRTAAPDLFVNQTVANEAALEALVNKPAGYLVYKADNTSFWELIDPDNINDISVGWSRRYTDATNGQLLSSLERFLSNLSNKLDRGSFIAHVDQVFTDPVYLMTWFAVPADSVIQYDPSQIAAYGLKLEAGVERHYIGNMDPSKVILYCTENCELAIDLLYTA